MSDTRLAIFCTLSLLLGGLLGALVFADTEIQYVDKVVNVPGPERVVEVETQVEVVKSDYKAYLDLAIQEFLNEVDDEEDYQVCDGEEYDFDQIKVSKVYDEFTLTQIDVDDEKYQVDAKIKLKYTDKDVEEKCYNTYSFSVLYEEDEDTEVSVD